MPPGKILSDLPSVFSAFPEVVAVYLFGSYLEHPEQARDVDLAVLLKWPLKSPVNIYMALYPHLAEIFSPLEVDLLFLNTASLPVCFEALSTGMVVYCADDELRTDFEYAISGRYMDFKYHLEKARDELFEEFMEGCPLV
ncbi:MAG: hypothetical protein IMW93_02540 [Thermoanaerobacteraceae bacterium]|nr:hypothetical protein [Thermoanaerobacteraceae bacterium]